jgi:hypothetical protein
MIKQFFFRMQGKNRGQSFVELALVVLILALILSGVVEFGFLLNSYLKVLDGSREGARYANNGVAFEWDALLGHYASRQDFYVNTTIEALLTMSPVILNGNRGDDVVISVFSVGGTPSNPTIVRWPEGYDYGWNLCDNRLDTNIRMHTSLADWSSCTAKRSNFSTSQVLSLMDPNAPGSGIVLVEVFYHYPQLLKLPVFEQVIPDPIPVYTYSMMPLSSAAPTPGP